MESNSYLHHFGNCVRETRTRLKMNQVEFYHFLFPDTGKEEENIKKKMNAIEVGKQRSVDYGFLNAFCEKCDISIDYAFGKMTAYPNYDIEFICRYTGLEENVVRQLHQWSIDRNNGADDLHADGLYSGPDCMEQHQKSEAKAIAVRYLKIINYLFRNGNRTKPGSRSKQSEPYSNLSVINSLYLMCMARPVKLKGTLLYDKPDYELLEQLQPFARQLFENISLDPNHIMMMQDDSTVWYPVDLKSLLEQIAKEHLSKDLDWLIEQVKSESSMQDE